MNEELQKYCVNVGIHKTSTAGYDPNANPSEGAVGTLKRYGRYLLSGARPPPKHYTANVHRATWNP